MSTNALYRGRRYKTAAYAKYIADLQILLPMMKIPEGPLALKIVFGVSNSRCDLDNLLKGTIDGMMAKYHFDDSKIHSLWAHKVITPKGGEFIEFALDRAR